MTDTLQDIEERHKAIRNYLEDDRVKLPPVRLRMLQDEDMEVLKRIKQVGSQPVQSTLF